MLQIGSLVDGKYKILNKVGQGGMSVVYLAMNEKANKQWAVKEVRKDGVLDFEKYEEYRSNLPADTVEQIIDGGNHACFGSYGPQEGDGESALASGEQLRWTADTITAFIGN